MTAHMSLGVLKAARRGSFRGDSISLWKMHMRKNNHPALRSRNWPMQWYNFFQVIVNIVSSAFAMCKCRLTWDLRLRRYCIKHKHEVLTFGPAFDVSSSQSGTHFWSTTVNLFYWGAIWKPHALLCIYGKVIHRSIGPLHEAFHPMRPLHFILLNSLQARKKNTSVLNGWSAVILPE